jgi:hypothetical protein
LGQSATNDGVSEMKWLGETRNFEKDKATRREERRVAQPFVKEAYLDSMSYAPASNPASGINNIPMNPAAGAEGAPMPTAGMGETGSQTLGAAREGIDPEELLAYLDDVIQKPYGNQKSAEGLADMALQIQDVDIQERVQHISDALLFENDPKKNTIDPATNEKHPSAGELAQRLKKDVVEMVEKGKKVTQAQTENFVQRKQKKKSRGNPFKVLMGVIQKGLDHGLTRVEIVKHCVSKFKFDEDTVYRAYDIVKDYNTKEHRKQGQEKKVKSSFNYARDVLAAKKEILQDIQPDWSKRSTGELLARYGFLKDVKDMKSGDKFSEGRASANKTDVNTDMAAIKSELKKRGFDEEELN